MNWRFVILLCASLLALGLLVAAVPTSWYDHLGLTEYTTYLTAAGQKCSIFEDCYMLGKQMRTMWICIFVSLIVAILSTVVVSTILFLWSFDCCHKHSRKLRVPLYLFALLSALSSMASWAFLLWQPHALDYSYSDFISSDAHPLAGWYLAICASALSVIIALVLPCLKRPGHRHYMLLN